MSSSPTGIVERKVELLVDGQWTSVKLEDLVNGDTFRMFEVTGEPVDYEGSTEFVAEGNAYFSELYQDYVVNIL